MLWAGSPGRSSTGVLAVLLLVLDMMLGYADDSNRGAGCTWHECSWRQALLR